MTYYEKRIKQFKKNAKKYPDIQRLVEQGKYYDELTDNQKSRWAIYYGFSSRETFEWIQRVTDKSLHFQITERPTPPTADDLKLMLGEVGRYIVEQAKKSEGGC